MKFLQELYFLRLIKLVDVWEIIIAIQPDMYVGRRKSTLSASWIFFKIVN
jgi:hypothetical protein